MERCERAKRVEFVEKARIDAPRRSETHPAMNDAVPDRDHFPAFEVIDGPIEQILEEFRVRQASALFPWALGKDTVIHPARDHLRGDPDIFDIAARRILRVARFIQGVESKPDARRARIDTENL